MATADVTAATASKAEHTTEETPKTAPSEAVAPNGGLTATNAQSDPPAQTTTAATNDAAPSTDAAKPSEGAGPAIDADAEMTDAPGAAAVPSGEAAAPSAVSSEPAAQEPDSNIDPVTIGFRTFASGKECYDYFRGLLSQLSHDQDLNEYEFTMVMDLLRKGHADPEGKIGSGVKAIQVKPHESLDSVCFFVHRTDGSKEDFSYRKCLLRLFEDLTELKAQDPISTSRGRGRGRGRSGGRGRGAGGGRGRGGRDRGRGRR